MQAALAAATGTPREVTEWADQTRDILNSVAPYTETEFRELTRGDRLDQLNVLTAVTTTRLAGLAEILAELAIQRHDHIYKKELRDE